jgi:hypothetical protein
MRWVTKNLYSWTPPCFERHVKPLVAVAFAVVSTHQSALGHVVGYYPFFLMGSPIRKACAPALGTLILLCWWWWRLEFGITRFQFLYRKLRWSEDLNGAAASALCVRSRKLSNVGKSWDGWLKIYPLEHFRASEGPLSRWSRLSGGLWSITLMRALSYKEGLCPRIGDSNRLINDDDWNLELRGFYFYIVNRDGARSSMGPRLVRSACDRGS